MCSSKALLFSMILAGLSDSALAQPKADAGSGPTRGAAQANGAGSGPINGENSAGVTPGPKSTGGSQPTTPEKKLFYNTTGTVPRSGASLLAECASAGRPVAHKSRRDGQASSVAVWTVRVARCGSSVPPPHKTEAGVRGGWYLEPHPNM
jgi:hypothetical protein